MNLQGRKLSDTYKNLLCNGPDATQTITLGDNGAVPWQANGIVVINGSAQIVTTPTTFNTLTIPSTVSFTSNGQFVKAGSHTVTLTTSSNSNITFSSATARTYTVTDPGANASFVMTEGAQTINGNKTFNGSIVINGDTDIGLTGTATNLFGTGASTNRFGDGVTSSNTFGNDVTGGSATNSFGNRSRFNYFGTGATTNEFGTAISGSNNFGNLVSGSSRFNNFGSGLISGAQNHFGPRSINYFGQNGENYFYSGLFAGPVTLPATVSYTSAGQIVKAGAHSLGLTTTAGTTGIFPTGNITIAALEGTQTFAGEKTFSSGINILKTSDQLVLGVTQKTTITAPTPASARTYTIPDVGENASFVMTTGNQTIGGAKTFTTGVILQVTGDQLTLRTGVGGNKIDITAPNISGNRIYTLPDVSGNASFVMTTGTQTIGGLKTFTTRPTVNGSGVFLSGEAVPGAYTAYSLEFGSGLRLTNGNAPFTWNGNQSKKVEVDTSAIASLTGNQTLDGLKTFNTGIIIQVTGNQLTLRTGSAGNKIDITAPTISGNRIYTIPDIGENASFVMTNGSQDITGTKTFASQLIVTTGSNQLVLRTGSAGSNSFTITAPTISGNRTYTLPDVSGNASFIMSTGSQTINGGLNFTTRPTINGVNVLLSGDTTAFTRVEATNLVYNTGEQVISGRKRFRNASVVPYGPFVNDVDADFNGLLSSREVYFTDDGSVKSAIEIPTLDIVYETGATSLTPRIGPTPSFSRTQTNTSGSYLGSDGYIKYATGNQPRFDHEISKNLFYGSNSFTNFWRYPEYNAGFTEAMIQQNADINPFKSAKNAEKFIDITGSGTAQSYIIRRDAVLNSGLNYTMSVFAKPINNNFIILTLAGGTRAFYNLSNGSISGMGGGTIISSGIDSSYGNGWSRLWLSIAYNAATTTHVNSITSSNSTGALTKTVTTRSDAFYLWGPQLEESPTVTTYDIAYGNWWEAEGALTGTYKSFRAPKGLLIERDSANLVLNSNDFPTNSGFGGSTLLTGGVWPDNSQSGSVFVETQSTEPHYITRPQIPNIITGINYVSSIFLKQAYDGQYSYSLTGAGGTVTGTGYYSFSNGVVFRPGQGNVPSSANLTTYDGSQIKTGRRYVIGELTGLRNNNTAVVIDLHSGISGGRVAIVPGSETPSFYTGIRYPNNWYRLIIGQVATGSATNLNYRVWSTNAFNGTTGSQAGLSGAAFQMFGHQIETAFSGDGATSYKPTTGTSGLLGRDTISIDGSDFSGFYNQSEGTFFLEGQCLQTNTNQYNPMFAINSNVNRGFGSVDLAKSSASYQINFVGSGSRSFFGDGANFLKSTGSFSISAIASYKENNFNASFYNEAVQIDTTGNLGLQRGSLIFGGNGGQTTSMYLQRFSYWPLQFQNNKLTGIYRY